METQPGLGGMKMMNLRIFDLSLKLSWFKSLMYQSYVWAEFPTQYRIMDTLKYGDLFPKEIIHNIKNKFWKDVVRGIMKLNETLKFNKPIQTQNMPLWHSSKLNIEYRKDWGNKAYYILNDLLDNNGKLLTNQNMTEKNININFLDYHKLQCSVKKLKWTQWIYQNSRTTSAQNYVWNRNEWKGM